ncbi:MAG: hypothetical protein AAGD96_07085 [Chloroflexota bacterium]
MSPNTSDSKTYLLKIIQSDETDTVSYTSFMLEDQQTGYSKQFESPEEFATCILQYQRKNQPKAQISCYPTLNSGFSMHQQRAEMLEKLLVNSKKKLDKLRYQMTDKISSARTKIGVMKKRDLSSEAPTEKNEFDRIYQDLIELSVHLENWGSLSEIVDPRKLSQPEKVEQMVSFVSSEDLDVGAHY